MIAWTRRRRPTGRTWRELLWHTPPVPVLVDEADRLTERGRHREAARILAVAASAATGDERRPVLERLAVSAADSGHHDLSRDAVLELDELRPRTAGTWVALANVALARGNHLHADRAARSALATDPADQGAWVALTASYAGLGWFGEAGRCLDNLDRETLTGPQRRRIGRAIDGWAGAGAGWWVAALVVLTVGGYLTVWSGGHRPAIEATAAWIVASLAAAGLTPVLRRRWRLRSLDRTEEGRRARDAANTADGTGPDPHLDSDHDPHRGPS